DAINFRSIFEEKLPVFFQFVVILFILIHDFDSSFIKWEHPNVDIGICACHVWLGLIDKGYNPKITVHEESERAIWRIKI
ncbi:MAG TPA: hypothetical protein VKX40_05310, partial [Aequorivita sp.]|nr:hypothetical protein [Aequorivita sp.]